MDLNLNNDQIKELVKFSKRCMDRMECFLKDEINKELLQYHGLKIKTNLKISDQLLSIGLQQDIAYWKKLKDLIIQIESDSMEK